MADTLQQPQPLQPPPPTLTHSTTANGTGESGSDAADASSHSPRSARDRGVFPSPPASPEFTDFHSAASVSPPFMVGAGGDENDDDDDDDDEQQRLQRLPIPGTVEIVAPSSLRGSPARLAGLHLASLSSAMAGPAHTQTQATQAQGAVSLSPVTFTPAVHRDTASLPSFFSPLAPSTMPATGAAAPEAAFTPFTPFTPTTVAPTEVDTSTAPTASATGTDASAPAAVASSSALPAPGAMVSGPDALTPAASTPSHPARSRRNSGVHVDAPLNYSSQYSPSASTRSLMQKIAAKQSRVSASGGSGVAGAADVSAASAAAAAAVSAASPAPSAAPQRSGGFLSSLFGWGSSNSRSVPSTPNDPSDTASAPPPSYPHGSSSASSLKSSASTSSFPPPHHGHGHGHLSSSASHPAPLSSILAQGDSRRGSGVGTGSGIGIGPGAHHAARTPVSGHPLLVHALTPLSSREHSALLAYSHRLKSSLHAHEGKIAKLQTLKKRHQLSRNEETAIWQKFAISSLVSIASSLYHTHLLHCSALLQLEFSFTAELSHHLNRVQLVLDGKLPLATLLDDIENRVEAYLDEQEAQIDAAMAAAAAAAAAIAAEGDDPAAGSAQGSRSRAGSKDASSSAGESGTTTAVAAERKKREMKAQSAMRERRRSSSSSSSGSWVAGAASPSTPCPPSPQPSSQATAARPRSLSSSELKSRFLTSPEIEAMFWPRDSATVEEQVGALGDTAAKLERTYKEMQRKALSQTDSRQSRTFKLHSLLVRSGLDSELVDARLRGELFYLPMAPEQRNVQAVFDQLMLDQRCEEGKIVGRWVERVLALLQTNGTGGATAAGTPTPAATSSNAGSEIDPKSAVSPQLVQGFLDFLADDIFKKYNLSQMEAERQAERGKAEEKRLREAGQRQALEEAADSGSGGGGGGGGGGGDASHSHHQSEEDAQQYTLRDALSLYLSRMLFPKLGLLTLALRSDREADLDAWYAKKLAWVRGLTRAQLGINPYFLPPGSPLNRGHEFSWEDEERRRCEGGLGLGMGLGLGLGVGVGIDDDAEEEEEALREAAPLEPDEDEDETADSGSISNSGSGSGATKPASARSRLSTRNTVSRPFQSAMAILHRLNAQADCAAPIDLLFIFIRTVREITRLANAYLEMHRQLERKQNEAAAAAAASAALAGEANSAATDSTGAPASSSSTASPSSTASGLVSPVGSQQLNADNMFPLVMYVVIHSGVTCPHFIIGTLGRFLPQSSLHFGTAGYSLILVESAVAHVCDMSRSDVVAPPQSPHKKRKGEANAGAATGANSPATGGLTANGLPPLPPGDAAAAFCSPKSRTCGGSVSTASSVAATPSPGKDAAATGATAPAPATPMPPLPATPAASPLTPSV